MWVYCDDPPSIPPDCITLSNERTNKSCIFIKVQKNKNKNMEKEKILQEKICC